jgi:hypothetical protein
VSKDLLHRSEDRSNLFEPYPPPSFRAKLVPVTAYPQLRRLALALIATLPLAAPVGGRAEKLHLDFNYELTWHGVVVYKMETKGTIADQDYRLSYTGATLGLFDLLIAYESTGEAAGRIVEGAVKPTSYRLEARWHGEERHVVLDYAPDGAIKVDVAPPPEKENIDPVPVFMEENTIDPISAAMLAGIIGARPGATPCQATLHVFDGRQRYDVRLENEGAENLPKNSYSAYAGATIKCRMTVDRIAGFKYKSFAEPQRPPSVVWLASFAGGKVLLPVKLATETGLGNVAGTLTALKIDEGEKAEGEKAEAK